MGFQRMDDLGRYLSINIHLKRVSKSSYGYIVDRMQQRLSNWKTKNLYFVDRLTLTKAVLSCIPMYVMKTIYVPKSIWTRWTKFIEASYEGILLMKEGCNGLVGRVYVCQRS